MSNLYWIYNLPLQVWDPDEEEGSAEVVILNYMPRRERCESLPLSAVLHGMTPAEFFEQAALTCENLARLFREYAAGNRTFVYYPDEGMNKEDAP